ncbi:phage capsid protein [Zavarzinia sp. CC-PAN008]|uniref:phage capsid protein n=1 Tax=Zavarzinia sp. CC-PAN008 TaxID=3243332 RepID=UPI003F746C40
MDFTPHYVQQYSDNVWWLGQQKKSRLRVAVTEGPAANAMPDKGNKAYFDYAGEIGGQEITDAGGDSPNNVLELYRRMITFKGFDTGVLITDPDVFSTLHDPTNTVSVAQANYMGRTIDDQIIKAFFATATGGVDGNTAVPFPGAQVVAVNDHSLDRADAVGTGNVGLTPGKLRKAKGLLLKGEPDDDDPMFVAVTADDLMNLLTYVEVTSKDYNVVQALVDGTIDKWMGFTFIRTERLLKDGSNYRRIPVWCKSGMGYKPRLERKQRITERSDKRFNAYAYLEWWHGATRLEEKKVVEIKAA